MSILIKGMEMPKDHPLWIVVHSDGMVEANEVSPSRPVGWQTLRNAAIPVPPHGRLIDEQWLKDAMITTLEALKKNPKMDRQEMHLIAAFDTLRAMVEDAPTIIPAEEGE